MSDHKYTLLYRLDPAPEGKTRSELEEMNGKLPKEQQLSACDAGIFISLLYPANGSLSMLMLPVDGRPAAAPDHVLSDHEVFKVWAMLAHRLAESETLGNGQKMLCRQVHDIMTMAMRASSSGGSA